jgi:hypothetical protein
MSVSDDTSEHASASEIVMPTSLSHTVSSVLDPSTSGRNTISVVAVDATTAIVTDPAPCSAASRGSPICSRRRSIASSTTIALSTSMPTPSISPIIDKRLRLLPMK